MQLNQQASGLNDMPVPERQRLLDVIVTSLDDKKAEDVTVINLTGKTSIADHMIIASGRSNRQVAAIAQHIISAVKDAGLGGVRVEGLAQADWVLIDAGDVVVHLFRPEVREFYNLEKMWALDLTGEPALN